MPVPGQAARDQLQRNGEGSEKQHQVESCGSGDPGALAAAGTVSRARCATKGDILLLQDRQSTGFLCHTPLVMTKSVIDQKHASVE